MFFKDFMRGARDCAPVLIAIAVFGAVFGAVSAEKGLTLSEAVFMSAVVIGGASQFAAVQFWDTTLPYVTIILVVFAINFRHVLYSASISRKISHFTPIQKIVGFFVLTDVTYALSEKQHEKTMKQDPPRPVPVGYFFGVAVPQYTLWVAVTALGYVFGNLVENPEVFGLDFVLPIYFMALLFGFRERANWMPVVVISVVATTIVYLTLGTPWHISAGAFSGVILGALLGMPKEEPA